MKRTIIAIAFSIFAVPAILAGASPCGPSPTTLCIDDQPGDRRFRVEVAFQTVQAGGLSGMGKAVPLSPIGVNRGGVFWFFSADNPEMLLKVLDACELNGTYWVFYSAGTNVGLVTTVTDTISGKQRVYQNPDRRAAPPIQDTSALPCCTLKSGIIEVGHNYSRSGSSYEPFSFIPNPSRSFALIDENFIVVRISAGALGLQPSAAVTANIHAKFPDSSVRDLSLGSYSLEATRFLDGLDKYQITLGNYLLTVTVALADGTCFRDVGTLMVF